MSSESERVGEKGDRAGRGEYRTRGSAGTTVNSAVEHMGKEDEGGKHGATRRLHARVNSEHAVEERNGVRAQRERARATGGRARRERECRDEGEQRG